MVLGDVTFGAKRFWYEVVLVRSGFGAKWYGTRWYGAKWFWCEVSGNPNFTGSDMATSNSTDSTDVNHCTLTPYCSKILCKQSKHHELLEVLASITYFTKEEQVRLEKTIEKYCKEGLKKDDPIPDPEPDYRFPLLHWASALAKVAVVRYLITREGYNPNALTPQRDSAFHRAIIGLGSIKSKPRLKQLESLLNLMPNNIVIVNAKGQTPLLILVDMLMKRETSSQFFSDAIRAICDCALKLKPDEKNKALNTQNKAGNTALHLIVREDGMLADIKKLVEAKCNLNIENTSGLTALFVAEHHRKQEYVKLLLSHMPSCIASRRFTPRVAEVPNAGHYHTRSPSKKSPIKQAGEIMRKRELSRDSDSDSSVQSEGRKKLRKGNSHNAVSDSATGSEESDGDQSVDRENCRDTPVGQTPDPAVAVQRENNESGSAGTDREDISTVVESDHQTTEDGDENRDSSMQPPACIKCEHIKTESKSPSSDVDSCSDYLSQNGEAIQSSSQMGTSGLLRYLTMSPAVKQELGKMLQADKKKLEDAHKQLQYEADTISNDLLDTKVEKQASQTRIVELLKEVERLQSAVGDFEKKELNLEAELKNMEKKREETEEKLRVLNEGLQEYEEW
ncbi:uncharacterized protein [Ptychodera flava]|uniref:uncharacterized protein isoform X2 n=2 Tax=Ptychodera flava TaxID=63121 RepID=UPI00396A6337